MFSNLHDQSFHQCLSVTRCAHGFTLSWPCNVGFGSAISWPGWGWCRASTTRSTPGGKARLPATAITGPERCLPKPTGLIITHPRSYASLRYARKRLIRPFARSPGKHRYGFIISTGSSRTKVKTPTWEGPLWPGSWPVLFERRPAYWMGERRPAGFGNGHDSARCYEQPATALSDRH